jgi:archaellum component FlaC
MNVETGPKFQKHQSEQPLREDACELGGRRYMQDADITDVNAFLDEVEVDLDMLCTLVLNEVRGEVDSADIVIVDENALR